MNTLANSASRPPTNQLQISFVSAHKPVQVQTSPANVGAFLALSTFFCLAYRNDHISSHWTQRAMAAGVAASTVQGIWKAHGLSPHRWRDFKLSRPAFSEKLTDIVGLYVDPPAP